MKHFAVFLYLFSVLVGLSMPATAAASNASFWNGTYEARLGTGTKIRDFLFEVNDRSGRITMSNGQTIAAVVEDQKTFYVPAWGNATGTCTQAADTCTKIEWDVNRGEPFKVLFGAYWQRKAAATTPKQDPPPSPPPPLEKSAARFSSMDGQVEVSSDGGKNWRIAKLDMVLNAEDWVKTDEDSTCILSFADMSTFVLKPESSVIIIKPSGKDSKWKLVAGNIWVNVKHVLKDGTMEIDLNQAVAGIKGTTFSLWETGARNSSIIQVEEGVVAFRNKTTGQTVEVTAGQTVSATPTGFINNWTLSNSTKANEQFLFNNFNTSKVFNGGQPSWFYLGAPSIISSIVTYHWNDGRGAPAGTISLVRDDGAVVGPLQAKLVSVVYWEVRVDGLAPPGRYKVVDSDSSTWSQTNGAGFVQVKGYRQ